jgi:predicted nucleic acid-binding protein
MKNALIFIDTNIFLDFYRIRSGDVGLSLLKHIDNNHKRLITGNQVEMEYKKNRQRVILNSLGRLKTPEWGSLTPPAFLSKARTVEAIEKRKKEIQKQKSSLQERIEKVFPPAGSGLQPEPIVRCCLRRNLRSRLQTCSRTRREAFRRSK